MKENISVEATCCAFAGRNLRLCHSRVLFLRGRHALPHLGKQLFTAAPNWKSRPLYILAAWMKLFAATRSKRKFNNPVSFDEKRAFRGSSVEQAGQKVFVMVIIFWVFNAK